MKYFGGCDVGSTFTKAVILDETGKMVADTTIRSKINSEQSAIAAMEEVCKQAGLKDSKELEYLIGTGYGRNKVPFADENISEISCHAMGVHITPEREGNHRHRRPGREGHLDRHGRHGEELCDERQVLGGHGPLLRGDGAQL